MKKQRGNGKGSVFKRGSTWMVQLTAYVDGKRYTKTKGGFETKSEALTWCSLNSAIPDRKPQKTMRDILYGRWETMIQRCTNPNTAYYHRYGGRGISVCDEWKNFPAFEEWAISHGFREELQLDRIDNDGNYCPDNCHFVTARENSNNMSRNKRIEYSGNTYTLSQFARAFGIPYQRVQHGITTHGLTPEQVINKWKQKG